MKSRFLIATVVFWMFALLAFVPRLSAQDAEEIFGRLKGTYESIDALRAEFSQTMSSEFLDEEATSNGLLIASGEKYRVETAGQTLVTDGEVTWVYMPSQKQVLINDNTDDEATFSVSEFLFNYDDKFEFSDVRTETLDGEEHYLVSLVPRSSNAFFTEATLSMRARDNMVTRLEVVDVNGTRMVFRLKNIQINPSLEGDVFSFTPPEGAEVVDLRSS